MKLHKLFTYVSIVLLLSGIFMGLVQFPQVAKAESENWLSGWSYRKSLIVSGGIHVITVHYGSGNDVLGHTYINGLCQADFDDIRFTSSDGITLITDVTDRAKIDGNYAEFKVNVINSPIYVYYGAVSASGVYAAEVFSSGSLGDTDELTEHYIVNATSGQISGIARESPVTGFATSLEAEIGSDSGSTAQMALLLMNVGIEEIDGVAVYGKRIVALTETKSIPASDKSREVFEFETPVPIFRGTVYGIALWAGEGTTVWYQTGTGTGSFFFDGGFSGDMVLYTDDLGTYALGRFMNYVQVDEDEQNVLFRDNADYLQSRSLWHGHWEHNGWIAAEAGQGIGGSYAFDSTVTAPSGDGWGELAFLGEIEDGSKRFWSGVVRLSDLPNLDSHIELMAFLRLEFLEYPEYISLNGFGVSRTAAGVQWQLSVKSGGVWSDTLFGEVEANTDYLVILSYETHDHNAKSEVWVTKLSEPNLLEEASSSETLTVTNDVFANTFFIGAADYPHGNVSPLSAFFDEMTLTESFPATFGAWGNEEVFVPEPTVLSPEQVASWHWIDKTAVNSVVEADVDGDDAVEIVTAGYFNDGVRDVAQLVVWDGASLAVENIRTWYWNGDTRINSVAVADVDGDSDLEIVTGGYYTDVVKKDEVKIAQLVTWNGADLALEDVTAWYWTGDTAINSVAVADVDADSSLEIVTGGYFNDSFRDVAQLVVWDGGTLVFENVKTWYWTGDTAINSLAVANVDGDGAVEIVTGGYYTDGVKIAQLVTWSGADLAVEDIRTWVWTGDTEINSVAVADVDDDSSLEIVTGGYYTDGVKIAQLVTWSGADLAVEDIRTWVWTGDTEINSVAVADVDDDSDMEIVTGGYFNDGVRDVAQLVTWNGATLAVEPLTVWYWTGDTCVNSVAIGNVDADVSEEILTGGYYDDGANLNAQLVVWTITPD